MFDEELHAESKRHRSENAALKKGGVFWHPLKVSQKEECRSTVWARFPVTLYLPSFVTLGPR